MGKPSSTNPTRPMVCRVCGAVLLALFVACGLGGQTTTVATTVPLRMPSGLAYDAQGNLYVSETAAHRIIQVSATGILTVFAGTGTQGYAGDGGQAVAALLDSPGGLAISAGGTLCFADTHNHVLRCVDPGTKVISTVAGTGVAGISADGVPASQARLNGLGALVFDGDGNLLFTEARGNRVRRVDHATGLLSTVAGNGMQGFGGDGGAATAAMIDAPAGLAVDAAGNLYLSDAHNQRVRRVDATTGVISTVVGAGGDVLRMPRGVMVDAAGNLFVVEGAGQQVRRVDAATGAVTTVAGTGTQGFAGDGGLAGAALLDSPQGIVTSPAGLVTVADTANGRVRQVDGAAVIHTVAGLGAAAGTTLTLSAPTTMAYGTGLVTATLGASPATGPVTFFDMAGGVTETLTTVPLALNMAAMSTAELAVAVHRLSATYAGDQAHAAAQSTVLAVTIAPAQVVATPAAVALLYGQAVPVLGGTIAGVLARDAGAVVVAFTSGAGALTGAGVYPITATLSGPAAGNYALATVPSAVTIASAPVRVTLGASGAGYAVQVSSTTAGVPGGTVSLLDGTSVIGTSGLSSGTAMLGPGLSLGTHTLTAVYAGDGNFLSGTSTALVVTIGPAAVPDFTLAGTGQAAQTVTSGGAAVFSFAVTPVNGTLASPIVLSASGLPAGATVSFSPAYLPPGGAVSAFMLTVQTRKNALLRRAEGVVVAMMLPLFLLKRKRMRSALMVWIAGALLASAMGCAARVNTNFKGVGATTESYEVTVTGTATAASGAVLTHTANVTLVIQ